MNMNTPNQSTDPLALHLAASRAVPEDAVVAAQRSLQQRLADADQSQRKTPARWWPLATTAALVLAVLVAVPLLPLGEDAFAAVREHFRSFQTLSMQVEQRHLGKLVQSSHMLLRADGSLRTDVGDQLSVIIDVPRQRMLTLLHEPKRAMSMPLTPDPAQPDAALDWLQEIRQFQGESVRLNETRLIDGREAFGWRLQLDSITLTLWADADGLPLQMEQEAGQGLQLDFRFTFDPPIAADQLSSDVPDGYRLAEADQD